MKDVREIREILLDLKEDDEITSRISMTLALREAWMSLVGERLALHTEPYKVIKGTLFVAVESSVWYQEMVYILETLKKKLEEFSGGRIKDIKIKIKHKP